MEGLMLAVLSFCGRPGRCGRLGPKVRELGALVLLLVSVNGCQWIDANGEEVYIGERLAQSWDH
jgi:hypothetical protein